MKPLAAGLDRGTVVVVGLDPAAGHEQRGTRPCVVVSDPLITADQRYPLLAVVPVTRTEGLGALYPALEAGSGGLRDRSYALVDQVRSVDKRRVQRVFGQIRLPEIEAIDEGLRLFFGLRSMR